MMRCINGSLWASIFAFNSFFSSYICAQTLPLDSKIIQASLSAKWAALLHLKNDRPVIKDPRFMLSIDDFSPERELLLTIDFLKNSSYLKNNEGCRFIARAEFIYNNIDKNINFNEDNCIDYNVFLTKAPADKVSIIYASENLTQPSSMMGHSMLSISGETNNGWVEHGVSFFTELDTINLASILWDTLYVGKKGYFVIEPLSKSLNYYLRNEQRNIWQYDLELTKEQRSILHKHIWELRALDIDYFFHKHNCATLSLDILGVSTPKILDSRQDWVTPIDVVKAARSIEIIKETQVYPSSKWKVRMLTEFISDDELVGLENVIFGNDNLERKSILIKETAKTINQYNLEVDKISKSQWEENQESWLLNIESSNHLEINNYKSPTDSAGDSAYHMSIENYKNEQALLLGWLPTSHTLEDDNRKYFSESELKLSEFVVSKSLDDSDIDLYSWKMYSAISFTPYNRFTGGLSGGFGFGFDQFLHDQKETELAAYIKGSLGITHKINRDVGLYYLANVGQVSNANKSYAYIAPEVGGYIYEVFDMKSMFSIRQEFRANLETVYFYSFTQSIYLDVSSFIFDVNLIQNKDNDFLSTSIQYRKYF